MKGTRQSLPCQNENTCEGQMCTHISYMKRMQIEVHIHIKRYIYKIKQNFDTSTNADINEYKYGDK